MANAGDFINSRTTRGYFISPGPIADLPLGHCNPEPLAFRAYIPSIRMFVYTSFFSSSQYIREEWEHLLAADAQCIRLCRHYPGGGYIECWEEADF